MKRIIITLLLAIMIITGCNKERLDMDSALTLAWEQFNIDAYQVGLTDPTIWMIVDDNEDITKLELFLEDHLPKEDLDFYQIKIEKKSAVDERFPGEPPHLNQ